LYLFHSFSLYDRLRPKNPNAGFSSFPNTLSQHGFLLPLVYLLQGFYPLVCVAMRINEESSVVTSTWNGDFTFYFSFFENPFHFFIIRDKISPKTKKLSIYLSFFVDV